MSHETPSNDGPSDPQRQLERLLRLIPTGDPATERIFADALRALMFGGKRTHVELEPGTRLGSYVIIRWIGSGAMASVFLARHDSREGAVALKVTAADDATDHSRRRFLHEETALRALNHPGIVRIYEAGEAIPVDSSLRILAKVSYIAMEYVDGDGLLEYVAKKRPSHRRRISIFAKICEAVNYAHQQSIIHRDLKPSNILVTAVGSVKILDFGVARLVRADLGLSETLTGTGDVVGTLNYMSPEQARGATKSLTAAADVFSLGVILYQLLAESLPSIPAWAERLPDLRVTAPRAPRAIHGILSKALDIDPTYRYPTAELLLHDVTKYLNGARIAAIGSGAITYCVTFFKRYRSYALTALVTLLIVLITFRALRLEAGAEEMLPTGLEIQGEPEAYVANPAASGRRLWGPEALKLVGREMLTNGDCEARSNPGSGIVGWKSASGDWQPGEPGPTPYWAARCPTPYGQHYFWPNTQEPVAECYHDVDVSALASEIDGGCVSARLRAESSSLDQNEQFKRGEETQIILELRGRDPDTVIDEYESYPRYSPQKWYPIEIETRIPPETRHIRVRLRSLRRAGKNNDGFFDQISLVLTKTK